MLSPPAVTIRILPKSPLAWYNSPVPHPAMHLRLFLFAAFATAALADPPEPKFHATTLDDKIRIGYGVAVADVDGDKLPDVLLADKRQFAWYKNPGGEKAHDPAA